MPTLLQTGQVLFSVFLGITFTSEETCAQKLYIY